MALRFVYSRPADGGISIVTAANKQDLERVFGPMTDDDYRDHVYSRSIPPDAQNVQELTDDWAPPEKGRAFRDAWVVGQKGVIVVDMIKAREIHRKALILEGLDAQHPAIDTATTPEELIAVRFAKEKHSEDQR